MSAISSRLPHDVVQTIANVISTVVAVAALIYSTLTYQNTVHSSNRDQARRDWSEYLKMTSENQDLSFDSIVINFDSKGNNLNRVSNRRYDVFMNRMYFYMNSIVEGDGIENWEFQFTFQLEQYGVLQCQLNNGPDGDRLKTKGLSPEFISFLRKFYAKNCDRILDEYRSEGGRFVRVSNLPERIEE